MRIGIIGGGAAGLGAAWLLSDRHDVTLFERQAKFGGHADTVVVDVEGEAVAVDAGFEFFSDTIWPTFCRLLSALGVGVRPFAVRLAVHRPGGPAFVLPPTLQDLRRLPPAVAARRALDLGQLGLVLARGAPTMLSQDTSLTVGELLDGLPLTASFRDEFLLPYLLSSWCAEPDEFREFSAYDVLRYTYAGLSWRGNIAFQEVVGGTRAYVEALRRGMPRAVLKPSASIERIEREGAGFRVHEPTGGAHSFDHLVVATSARDARALLGSLPGLDRERELLGRIEYFRTAIAVHEDRRLMPADERDWSIINVRHDGRHAQMTVWKPWRSKAPVFRSWVTYDAELPRQVHHLVHYDHPKVTPTYFEVQRSLAGRQGQGNLWLAGMYTHDIDSHESALVSAVNVARRLDPDAPRLELLGAKE
jgi:predicted NAD/FAD-binding protein